MLRNIAWLDEGQPFPPMKERPRIQRYIENALLFDGEHFGETLRARGENKGLEREHSVYHMCADRISKVVGNFDDIISFPVLLNYQRMISLKTADLVCGEYPSITGATSEESEALRDCRNYAEFDSKLYSTAIDISRYGDAVWRIYLDNSGRRVFTCWDPKEWYPIVSQDGTNTIQGHVLCWRVNTTDTATELPPNWELHAQIHWCGNDDDDSHKVGEYIYRVYQMSSDGTYIQQLLSEETIPTGLQTCAVIHLKAFGTSSTVYGYDDYMPIDSILAEIMARIGQISVILDKHADPNITGPVTMLQMDTSTGEYHLRTGKFFATSAGENEPKYMTWDGQLTAAFKQLEFLINQLYILSEMGAALMGGESSGSGAVSGAAMRFKMVNPLAKVRRIANSLTLPVVRLFSELSADAEVEKDGTESDSNMSRSTALGGNEISGELSADKSDDTGSRLVQAPLTLPIPQRHISVFWADGLPDDPRENIENCKLATGVTKMMPLETAIMEYFGRSAAEARQWMEQIRTETEENMVLQQKAAADAKEQDPNHPGPQDGTGVNPTKKGSTTGLNNFKSDTNKEPDDG